VLRIGLIGAGANTRSRHIPGLLAQAEVRLVAVCNRRPESTAVVARDFAIPRTYDHWPDLVADPQVDAVVIGTWPYLHAPITLAALAAGKHVLTEARMALNADEARAMLDASRARPDLVCQIVPSPFGLAGERLVRRLLAEGVLGELREVSVIHRNAAFADPQAPLHWRQDATLSGHNMLTLGILHETVSRWLPQPLGVMAQTMTFTSRRPDADRGGDTAVGTPDLAQVLLDYPDGARGVYLLSGVTPSAGQEMSVRLLGTRGVLHYDLQSDTLTLQGEPLVIPEDLRGGWRVEADFVRSIRTGLPVTHTDFPSGVAYMEFTSAVHQAAGELRRIALPRRIETR
jgi:predicted dehydrogenase